MSDTRNEIEIPDPREVREQLAIREQEVKVLRRLLRVSEQAHRAGVIRPEASHA
ncbi:MAG: hypothetical protein U0836_20650 [Pirellulales bacterium]